MFLDTRKVPELEGLSYQQRMMAIQIAQSNLPLGQKALLNTIKFIILAPVFFLIAKEQSWSVLPWLLLTFFVYPLVTKPLTLWFVKGLLSDAVAQLPKSQSNEG